VPGEAIQFDMIVGLGNPGSEHEQQRHNAGFWYLDELARELGVTFTTDKKSFSQTAKAQLNGRTVHLVKPYNYMNNSGQGFSAVARFFKIDVNKILVAHDELDMPPGHIRLKQGGGHGGHNGFFQSLLGPTWFTRHRCENRIKRLLALADRNWASRT
jgi:PTH1 family peptidyl-tRNA hydrolase